MLIICERPQAPPCGHQGIRLAWVTRVPVKLRCSVFTWLCINGAWRWSRAWTYDFPANQTWGQVVDSFPEMEDIFRAQYKTDYYVFAESEQLAALHYFHENGDV